MYSSNYFPIDYNSYTETPFNGYNSDINQPVGYNWYQSCSVLGDLQQGGWKNDCDYVYNGVTESRVVEPPQVEPPGSFRSKVHNNIKLARVVAWKKQLRETEHAERLGGRPCTEVNSGCRTTAENNFIRKHIKIKFPEHIKSKGTIIKAKNCELCHVNLIIYKIASSTIKLGEKVINLGPNGCARNTLLKLMGLENFPRGVVMLGEQILFSNRLEQSLVEALELDKTRLVEAVTNDSGPSDVKNCCMIDRYAIKTPVLLTTSRCAIQKQDVGRVEFEGQIPKQLQAYRFKIEECSHTTLKKFNVISNSSPEWILGLMPTCAAYFIVNFGPSKPDINTPIQKMSATWLTFDIEPEISSVVTSSIESGISLHFGAIREHWPVINGMHNELYYATNEDAWCWNAVKLVFDPGGCGSCLQRCSSNSHILEDKDILRGMDCNQLDIFGPSELAVMINWAIH
ncbi:hypothetical protein POM88_052008 [Heracleum sosnowskyi]|uniref:Alkaline/neutral invertase n=1 Tax=Heracleum sosnowskyi TaxID=360622 RepID=A0AAD8LYY6_9APIA|nr:hypothetical protein POM88_052008 [Heracleum sosnowskyi]